MLGVCAIILSHDGFWCAIAVATAPLLYIKTIASCISSCMQKKRTEQEQLTSVTPPSAHTVLNTVAAATGKAWKIFTIVAVIAKVSSSVSEKHTRVTIAPKREVRQKDRRRENRRFNSLVT